MRHTAIIIAVSYGGLGGLAVLAIGVAVWISTRHRRDVDVEFLGRTHVERVAAELPGRGA